MCGWPPDVALMLLYIIHFASCTDFPVPLKGTSKKGYRIIIRKEVRESKGENVKVSRCDVTTAYYLVDIRGLWGNLR